MDLLFKRKQIGGVSSKVHFELWAKLEVTEEEQALIRKYSFHDAVLIDVQETKLWQRSALVAFFAFVGAYFLLNTVISTLFGMYLSWSTSLMLPLLLGGAGGYYYFHKSRETIHVKDLLHGRTFKCPSVVELARKEAGVETITAYFRQVLETAKNWDGTSKQGVQPLPVDESRKVILSGPVY